MAARGPPAALGAHRNAFLLALRLFAAIDAWRLPSAAASAPALVAAVAIGVLTAAPHVARRATSTVRSDVALERVFAEEEPTDVSPARGSSFAGGLARNARRAGRLHRRCADEPPPGTRELSWAPRRRSSGRG